MNDLNLGQSEVFINHTNVLEWVNTYKTFAAVYGIAKQQTSRE